MKVFKSPSHLAFTAAAVIALTACSATSAMGAKLWPFGGGDKPAKTATKEKDEEGRISILTFDQKLAPEAALNGRSPTIPEPLASADWPQPGGPSTNAPVHVAAGNSLRIAWRASAGEGSSRSTWIASPPVIAGGKLYVLDGDGVVRAFEAGSGKRLWEHSTRPAKGKDKTAIGGGVAVAEGRLFAASGFGAIIALDASTGKQLWRTASPAPFRAAPTAADGKVFAVTSESELMALDAATGEVTWTHQAIAEPAGILAASSPAVSGDTIVTPFSSGEVIAMLAANGRQLWIDALTRNGRLTSLSAINDIAGRPVIADGAVYAVSHSGVIAAIDQRSGQRVWARGLASTQTPWPAGDALYVVSTEGELAALDRKTGGAFWVTQLPRYDNEKRKSGRVSWTGPILAGGNLILASTNGEVKFVAPTTGAVNSTLKIGEAVFIPPVAANGYVYLVTDKAKVVALH